MQIFDDFCLVQENNFEYLQQVVEPGIYDNILIFAIEICFFYIIFSDSD